MTDVSDQYEVNSHRKICHLCGLYFESTYLKRHLARKHGFIDGRGRRTSCPLCQTLFNFRKQLRSHIKEIHNVEITAYSFELDNCDDFFAWFKEEENSNKIRFFKARSPKQLDDGTKKWNYYCQYDNSRNTTILALEERRRALKKVGSCKMTGCCPAEIIVTVPLSQKVYVEYYSTHIGHEISLDHFRLSYESRRDLADKIEAGLSFDTILNDIRVADGMPDQHDRISRKTLYNIAATISVNGWKLAPDVGTSVSLWVESMKKLNFNPVCLFKKQGEHHPTLDANDFLLIVVTKIQAKMLREFGNRLICVKSTAGTKQYDFSLTTILVVDDHEEPFPAAFLVSNRVDETVLRVFFDEISAKIDAVLAPTIFLSDDNRVYFRAWSKVMKPKTRPTVMVCSWDVDKNWRLALNKIDAPDGKLSSKQVAVYRMLRLLLEETSQANFFRLLGSTMTDLLTDEQTRRFGRYFKRRYVNRFGLWANAFRVGSERVYASVENCHRAVAKAFAKGSKMKRLDACVYGLLRTVRDKHIERVSRLTNEIPFAVQKLRATHRAAMAIADGDVQKSSSYFCVISHADLTAQIVEKIYDTCPFGCALVCRRCDVCVHAYQCSCADYAVKCNMCVHVHKVCHLVAGKADVLSDSSDVEVVVDLDDESENGRSSPANDRQLRDEAAHELNASIERLVELRDAKIGCSVQALEMAKRKVDEAVAILTNEPSSPERPAVSKLNPSPCKVAASLGNDSSNSKESSKRPTNNQQPEPTYSLYEPQEIEVEMVDISATFDHVY